jgi:hypothetical protein
MTPPTGCPQSCVNRRLTPKRLRRAVENHEYGAFVRRVIRAYSRRVAAGDIEAISAMLNTSAEMDTAIQNAITGLRAIGYSYADIALRLGVTRQAIQQRWGTTTGDTVAAQPGRNCA